MVSKKQTSVFLILIYAVLLGSIGIYVKTLTHYGFSELEILTLRSLGGAVLLGLLLFFQDRPSLHLQKITDIRYFIATGIFSFLLFGWTYLKTLNLTGVGVAAVLFYTSPVFVSLFSCIFLKEKFSFMKAVILFLNLFGCILSTELFHNTNNYPLYGILIGISSGFFSALYSLFSSFALKKYKSPVVTFYTFAFASFALAFKINILSLFRKVIAKELVPFVFILALFTAVIPYLCYTKALEHLPSSKVSVIATTELIVATLLGAFLYGESLSFLKLSGIFLIIYSVLLNQGKIKTKV